MATRRNPQALIEQRRKEEDFRKSVQDSIDVGNRAKSVADWEIKSQGAYIAKQNEKRSKDARAKELANLEARRRNLAALLAADERQYRVELDQLAETPEQARARLMAKAKSLKDARESARSQLAQEKLTQQLRENIDELRTQNSAIFSKQCAADTRLQLERRREDMEKELAAEAEFTKVLEADRLRKEQREKDEAEARHRSNLLTKQILDEQTALREKLKGNSHAEREREMAKYAAMAAADAEKLAKREEAMMAAKRTAQREILKFNEDYQASKASAKAQRLAEERAMNIAAAEALAGEAGRKEAEKKARLQEMVEYSAYINSLKAEQAKIDAELEKMRAEAQEAAWRQRESKWNAEQAAREALNREVNESIRQQLLYRAEMQAKEIEEGKRIQAMLVAEQQRLEAEEKRRYAERIEKSNNRELMQQIADRERARKEEFEAGVREAALMKQREEEKRLLLESELRNYKPEPRSFALKTTKWYT